MKTKLIVGVIMGLLFTGCSSMSIEDFNDAQPTMIPQQYFNGKMKAYGLVKNRSGKIIRSFIGDMHGSWDEKGVGTLQEHFVYNDGETQDRTWTLKPTKDAKHFIGTAGDIIGEAPMVVNGNTVMMDYTMRIPYGDDGTLDINVRDWLHLQADGVIINHSKMKKFGFVVGELVITIIKQ
jgi:hypothetical protein